MTESPVLAQAKNFVCIVLALRKPLNFDISGVEGSSQSIIISLYFIGHGMDVVH